MTDLLQATITIDSITEKGNRVSVKTTSGGSYSYFKTKKDGNLSMAAKQMTDMGLASGMTVDIAYDITEGEWQGKKIQYKNIKSFREPSLQTQPISDSSPKTSKSETEYKPRDYDRENWGKCKYGFLIEAYKLGKSLTEVEKDCELWADASMGKLEDIDVKDIPF